jgi:hypothetical protein
MNWGELMAKEYILKDRFGKDHTYNDETIYVRGTDGELMPFTQGTVEPLTITENGTYTAPDGVSYNPVTVAQETKLQDKTVTENGEYTADAGYDGLGKVTVEVAGSGGGSLPAGGYYEQIHPNMPQSYQGRHFVFKGELYLIQRTASSGDVCNIYKFINGEYTPVLTSVTIYSGYACDAIEYNGVMHLIRYKNHYTFDGTSVTKLATPSYEIMNPAVIDGKLYGYTTNGFWEWDDANGAWIERNVLSWHNYPTFTVNGKVYMILFKELKEIDIVNGVATTIKTFDSYLNYFYTSASGEVILGLDSGGSNYPRYAYDVEKDELTLLHYDFFSTTYLKHYTYNGEDRFDCIQSGMYNAHLRLHIVKE